MLACKAQEPWAAMLCPLAGREGSEEASGSPEKKRRKGRGDERLESDQTSKPRVQPLSTSRFHETPLKVYSKFPFCQAGLSCFLLLETKTILTYLVSH